MCFKVKVKSGLKHGKFTLKQFFNLDKRQNIIDKNLFLWTLWQEFHSKSFVTQCNFSCNLSRNGTMSIMKGSLIPLQNKLVVALQQLIAAVFSCSVVQYRVAALCNIMSLGFARQVARCNRAFIVYATWHFKNKWTSVPVSVPSSLKSNYLRYHTLIKIKVLCYSGLMHI